jgi:hypothetical protein
MGLVDDLSSCLTWLCIWVAVDVACFSATLARTSTLVAARLSGSDWRVFLHRSLYRVPSQVEMIKFWARIWFVQRVRSSTRKTFEMVFMFAMGLLITYIEVRCVCIYIYRKSRGVRLVDERSAWPYNHSVLQSLWASFAPSTPMFVAKHFQLHLS